MFYLILQIQRCNNVVVINVVNAYNLSVNSDLTLIND